MLREVIDNNEFLKDKKTILLIALAFLLPILILNFHVHIFNINELIDKLLKEAGAGHFIRYIWSFLCFFGLSYLIVFLLKIKLWIKMLTLVLITLIDVPLLIWLGIIWSCKYGDVCL